MPVPPGYRSESAHTDYLSIYQQMLADWPAYEVRQVPTRFGTTAVLTCGQEGKPPLLLLHGKYTPSPGWAPVIGELARHYRVYAVDTMGEPGLSEATGQRLRALGDFTTWLSETLDGLGLEAAHLAGHSFGGHLATRFAIAVPARVHSLTLIEPAQVFARFNLTMLLRSIPPFLSPKTSTTSRYYRWLGQGIRRHHAAVELATAGMLAYGGHAPEDLPMRGAVLGTLAVPTQQLIGAQTVVHSPLRAARRAARFAPHVRSILVHNASHFLIYDQPGAVLRALATLPGGPGRPRH